jgi:PIN domain nuclease of toxin-antitoxin system
MATKNIVDAHALVWYLEGNPRLGMQAKAVLDDPTSELILPDIRNSGLVQIIW